MERYECLDGLRTMLVRTVGWNMKRADTMKISRRASAKATNFSWWSGRQLGIVLLVDRAQ
jgi:hypothetical protein